MGQKVWHEKADYSADQIQFQTGQIIGKTPADKNNFKIFDQNGKSLYAIAMDNTQWQNFALKLDYTKKYVLMIPPFFWPGILYSLLCSQVQIYYSVGAAELKSVAGPTSASLSGGGQFQIGILKKPTGTSDVVNGGYQESKLNEGQIYGGIFLEDSANNCISL